jgi:hypothetical protein
MKHAIEFINLSEEEKLSIVKAAKGGSWYYGWKPYCMIPTCKSGLVRMAPTAYGFRCSSCGNMIGFDLKRLAESPLNTI